MPVKIDARESRILCSLTYRAELEKILKCPLSHAKLSWLNDEELAIANARFFSLTPNHPSPPFEAALKAEAYDIVYGMRGGIFYLLPELALVGESAQSLLQSYSSLVQQTVKTFYDTIGWRKQDGVYQDARDSEDLRSVSQEYILQCHLRLKKHLPSEGQFLLDVASGPLQYPSYLTYADGYQVRICADLSVRALEEAKKKIGEKGIYLLCDITRLPLQTEAIDAVLSLHTLYHVAQDQQLSAFKELYRVLKPQGKAVVVYSWGKHAWLMKMCFFPFQIYSFLKRKFKKSAPNTLYFYAHPYRWFYQELRTAFSVELFSWRSVNVPFLKVFIHSWLGGRQLLKGLFWLEDRFPRLMGRIGVYPVFVSKK